VAGFSLNEGTLLAQNALLTHFGGCRALRMLYQHETRHDAVRRCILRMRLRRNRSAVGRSRTLLTAASVATNDLWQYGTFTPHQRHATSV